MQRALLAVACILVSLPSYAQDWGEFRGAVKTEWLSDQRGMKLLEDFAYVSADGVFWVAPADSIVDGASIPRFAWSFIGGPFAGKYRKASVIHDVACDDEAQPWEAVHYAFYQAMRASGVSRSKAMIMYAAVYHFGPRWPRKIDEEFKMRDEAERRIEALKAEAAPGSTIASKISEVSPKRAGDPATFELWARISPSEPTITQPDFDRLKDMISSNEEEMSLTDIRSWTPQ